MDIMRHCLIARDTGWRKLLHRTCSISATLPNNKECNGGGRNRGTDLGALPLQYRDISPLETPLFKTIVQVIVTPSATCIQVSAF